MLFLIKNKPMKKNYYFIFMMFINCAFFAQTNIVSYAGNSGKETFYDVMQITDGTFIVTGYADDLNWIAPSIPRTQLTFTGTIPNAGGTNRYGFLLHLSSDLQTILKVIHFPQGVVEDIRFIKTSSQPYTPTGDLFISCNTTVLNPGGGYVIAKLNGNFINNDPTALVWNKPIWADGETKLTHPWDVTSTGEVYYVTGKAHGPDWSAVYCLNSNGVQKIVPNWRTHWSTTGSEWRGTPASASPNPVAYSGIALKSGGRAELRSWNDADFNSINPDGNGGTRKGKWPADFMFNTAGNPITPVTTSPGYNNYSSSGGVYGATSLIVDRRNDKLYIGMNFQTTIGGTPDFEPAVICYDNSGTMIWWIRLYHEITPAGTIVSSTPDQYVDALAIDYTNNKLVVGARCHGNQVSNLWNGNTIAANSSAAGFQNQFTGTNGNIHISWLGKFSLDAGNLFNSTYMAEFNEGATLGTALTAPNMDSWPNPNAGWPNLNTTRMAKNALKVSSNGDVCVLAVGRRTITTANAYQKMIKPAQGVSSWNEFVRVYDTNFNAPKYSSLIGGTWDPVSGVGGDNTDLFGVCKTSEGVVVVGRHVANATNIASGNAIPVVNVVPWGNATPDNESAILVYYKQTNLANPNDTTLSNNNFGVLDSNFVVYPNPASTNFSISFPTEEFNAMDWKFSIVDLLGRTISEGKLKNNSINVETLNNGIYNLKISSENKTISKKIVIKK
jgi:Secretion system C-terminal sorting domain